MRRPATVASIFLGIGSWGAEVSGVANQALGTSLMVIGAIGFFGAILWGLWPKIQSLRWKRRKLSIEPRLDSLSNAYPSSWTGAQLASAFAQHSFAVLHVRNEWRHDLNKIVARCFLSPLMKSCHVGQRGKKVNSFQVRHWIFLCGTKERW